MTLRSPEAPFTAYAGELEVPMGLRAFGMCSAARIGKAPRPVQMRPRKIVYAEKPPASDLPGNQAGCAWCTSGVSRASRLGISRRLSTDESRYRRDLRFTTRRSQYGVWVAPLSWIPG